MTKNRMILLLMLICSASSAMELPEEPRAYRSCPRLPSIGSGVPQEREQKCPEEIVHGYSDPGSGKMVLKSVLTVHKPEAGASRLYFAKLDSFTPSAAVCKELITTNIIEARDHECQYVVWYGHRKSFWFDKLEDHGFLSKRVSGLGDLFSIDAKVCLIKDISRSVSADWLEYAKLGRALRESSERESPKSLRKKLEKLWKQDQADEKKERK